MSEEIISIVNENEVNIVNEAEIEIIHQGPPGAAGPSGAATVDAIGNVSVSTAGVSGSGVGLHIAGGSNITLNHSIDNQDITISIIGNSTTPQTVQTQNMVSILGSSGNISFVNSNGITFGGSNSTITASHNALTTQTIQTAGMVRSLNGSEGVMSISGGNGVTVGNTGSTITLSVANQSVQTQGMVSLNGSTGNLSLENANNVSFGATGSTITASASYPAQSSLSYAAGGIISTTLSGSTLTISATVPSQTSLSFVQQGAIVTSLNGSTLSISAPTQTVQTQNSVAIQNSSGNISFANGNGVTFGGNNSTITASVNIPAQTNQSIGVYGSSQTTGQSSSSTYDARSLTIRGAGIVSVGNSGGEIIISATAAGGPGGGGAAISAGSQTGNTTGTIAFSNSNNVSFGMSNNSVVTASASFNQTVQTQNSVQVQGSSGNISFANGNNITFGANNSTITASASFNQTNQTIGVYGSGNTAGTSSATADARSLSIAASGSLTVNVSDGVIRLSAPNVLTTAMASNRGSDFVQATAGFAGTNATGTIASNGISVSVAAPVAQTNQTIGLYGSSNTSGTSTGTVDARSLTVVGKGGVSVDMTNGQIVLSGQTTTPQTVQTQNMVSVLGSTGNISFANSNGISFGGNGSTITASYTVPSVPAQTNQTIGLYGSGNTSGTSTGTVDARSLTFNVAGSLTVDMTNGKVNISAPNAITTAMQSGASTQFVQANAGFAGTNANGTIASSGISVSVPAQTNQSIGLYGLGNTSGTSTATVDARSLSISAAGSITADMSGGTIRLSVPNAITTAMASNRGTDFVQANANFNGTNASGTIASNNISVSVAAQSAQTLGVYGSGNTAGTSSGTLDARSLTFDVAGSLTVNMSNDGKIHFSAPNAITTAMASNRGSDFVNATAAFAGTNANGTIASNGISVSVPAQTVQTQGLVPSAGVSTGGNTSGNTGLTSGVPLVFQGGNGLRLSQATATDGATIVISQLSQAYGVSSGGNTLGDTGVVQSRLVFAGGNNITLSQSTAAGQLATITISGPNTVEQTNQTIGIYGSSQTTGQSSSSTYDARSLTIRGAGVVSVGNSGGEILISASLPAGAGDGYNILAAGTQTANTSGTVAFVNSNNITFGMSNSSQITASFNPINIGVSTGGNTEGTTGTLDGGGAQFVFVGGSNVTLSQSLNGSSGTLSIHAGPDYDFFEPLPPLQSGSTTFAPGISSWYFQPVLIPGYIGPGRLNVLHTMGSTSSNILQGSNGTSYASNTTGGASQSYVLSRVVALYSRGAGTNNTRLESMWAATFPISISHSVGVSLSNATQITASRQVDVRYPSQVDISGNSTIATLQATHATSSAGSTVGTSFFTSALSSVYNVLSGAVMMHIPITAAISPGNYWLAHGWISGHTTAGSTLPTPLPALTAYGIYNSSSYNARAFGVTAASSGSQYNPGHGVYSVQSAAAPNNVGLREIRSYASNAIPYFNIMASSVS